jgi:aldehyde:ferredoxin oxidoreductase
MAWTRKILRVNLTQGTCSSEPLNMEWAHSTWASAGWRASIWSEIDPQVDPLSPENKIIYATGPLTGTMASTGGRYSVVTKGPADRCDRLFELGRLLRRRTEVRRLGHGHHRRPCAEPVYLSIENDKVELRDADDLWGKTVWETEGQIKSEHQDPQLRVSCIGRTGENGCCTPPSSTTCIVPPDARASAPCRVEEPEGDRGARHARRRQHRQSRRNS